MAKNSTTTPTELQTVKMSLALNEMLPAEMQCREHIKRLKVRLTALERPHLKLVRPE